MRPRRAVERIAVRRFNTPTRDGMRVAAAGEHAASARRTTHKGGLLPWGLAFAAGAMLYAICHEAIPGAHQQGHSRPATIGVLLGFVLMMLLDTALSASG
jgi:zinc transporter ZupT